LVEFVKIPVKYCPVLLANEDRLGVGNVQESEIDSCDERRRKFVFKSNRNVDIPYGEPECPVSAQEIEGKFFLLTQETLGKRAEEIRDQVMELERLKDISELIHKLRL